MITSNNWVVLRTKNPHLKRWHGPWFRFGRPGNITGLANYSVLAGYIGEQAYREAHNHFKCIRGIDHKCGVSGVVAQDMGLDPSKTHIWHFKAKK